MAKRKGKKPTPGQAETIRRGAGQLARVERDLLRRGRPGMAGIVGIIKSICEKV